MDFQTGDIVEIANKADALYGEQCVVVRRRQPYKDGNVYYAVMFRQSDGDTFTMEYLAQNLKIIQKKNPATVLVRKGRRYYKVRVNPLVKSKNRKSVGTNIRYLMEHPEELTAKTPEMKRKQAIAIALSVWRKASKLPAYKPYVYVIRRGKIYKIKAP